MNHRLLNLFGKYLTSLFFFITFVGMANGQVVTTGTDFWFTMLENFQQSGPIGMRVYISSTVGSTGTVSVPGCFFSQNFNCPPNGVVFVQLPNCAEPNGSGVIQNKAIRVTSVNPVSVYSLNASDFTTDGTMIMPVNTLGYDYYVMAYKNPGINDISESEMSFCAVMPNTQIELIPSVNTLNGFPAFVPQIITLNPGQMMQVKARGDLTGTRLRVIGNNCLFPIAVFGGNRCSVVGNNCTACDHLYEMISPISSLGRQYTYVPTFPGQTADMIRILAVQNGTNVTVNGVPQPVLNAGAFITLDANTINTTSAQISSNNPIAVASLGKGNSCRNPQVGDPMMMMLTPVDVLGVTSVNLATVDISPPNEHYVNLVTATPNTGNITITPAPINCEAWNPVPGNPALSTRRCRVNPGNFNVTSSGTGFNIYQYGWGRFDSYGMAGAGLVNQNTIGMSGSIAFVDSICTNTPKSFTAIAQNGNVIQRLTWDWGDNSPIETGPANTHTTRNHTYIGCGTFTIKVEYETNNGRFCAQRIVNVWAKPRATVQPPTNRVCPGGTTTFSVRFENTCTGRLPWGNQPGVVPFHAIYQINGVTQPPVVATGNRTITVTTPPVNSCQTYRFISVSNQYQPWTGTRCEEIMADSFTICPTPLQVNVVANPLTVCAGQSSTLTASGAVNYNWNNGQFLGNPFVVTPNVTTTYTVVGTDNNNCTASAAVTVTVNPAPEPPSVTPVNPVFCRGQQNACFTATHPNNNVTFEWSNGVNGPNNCVPTDVPGNFSIQVQVRLNGCASTFTTVNYSVQDILPPTPPQPQSVCAGTRAFFAIPNNEIQNGDQFFWRDVTKNTLTGPANNYTTPPMIPLIQDPVNGYPSPANFCVYRVRNGCQSECVPFSVNIIVPPAPNGSIAPNPICTNQLSELIVNGPNLPGVRFSWYTVANGGAPIFTNLVAGDRRGIGPFVTAGTYSYYLEANLLNCTSGRRLVTLTVQPSSVAGTINANPQTLCSGGNSQLTLSGHQGQILRWESAPTNQFLTVTNINNTTTTLNANNLTQSVCFRAVVQNNNCPPANNNGICIQVDQPPVAGTINPNSRTICEGTALGNIVLSGSSGNIIWESSTDCPTFTTFTTINNTTSTLTVGILTENTCYRARVSRGVCPSVVSNVFTATIDLPTIAGTITGTSSLCSGGASDLTLSGHRGTILRWESAPTNQFLTVSTINNNTTTYNTGNLTQTTCYRAVVQNGVCPSANSPAFCVQVDLPPVVGSINQPNVTLCQGIPVGNIVLSNASGTITWERSTDCPNFSAFTTINNNSLTLSVGVLNATTCYRARVSRGICPSVVSNIFTATILPTQPGVVQSSQTVCLGTDPNPLTLTNYTGNILRWESSTNGFLTTTTINNNTPNYQPTGLTTFTCFRAIVQLNSCTAPSTSACVRVDQPSIAGTLTANRNPVCVGGSVRLTLTGQRGNVLRWEGSQDPAFSTLTTYNQTLTTFDTPQINVVTHFRAVVQNGVCPPELTPIITITTVPNTERGILTANQTICDNNPNGANTLTLTGLIGSVIRWESSNNNFVTANSIQFQATTLRPFNVTQTTQYRVLVNTPNCGQSYTDPITVTVISANQGGTVNSNLTVCRNGNNGTLTLTGQAGTILGWERSTNNGLTFTTITPLNVTTSQNFTNLTVNTMYRVKVLGICGAVYSTNAMVRVVSNPIGGMVLSNQTVCPGQLGKVLILTAYSGRVTRWESSTDNGGTWTTINNTSPVLNPGIINQTTLFRAYVESDCAGTYSNTVTLFVPQGSAGTLSQDMTICGTPANGTLTLSGYTGSVAAWEGSTDNFITVQPYGNQTPTFSFENLTTTTKYRAKVNIGGCYLYSNAVQITVYQNLSAGFAGPDQTICDGSVPQQFVLEGYSGAITRWESSTDCFASQITTITHTEPFYRSGGLNQTTCFRAVITYPECGELASLPAKVTVLPIAAGGTITADQSICGTNPVNTLTLTGYSGTIVRWESSTDNFASFANISNTSDTYTPPTPTVTTKYRAVISSKGCGEVYSTSATITVIGSPIGGALSASQTICANTSPEPFTLTGYNGDILNWESSTDNFATITTININTPTLTLGNQTQSRCYRAKVGVTGCGTAYSNSVCISVVNDAVGGTLFFNQTVCVGNNPTSLILSGYSGRIIRWERSTDNFVTNTPINNTLSSYNSGLLTQTTHYRVVLQNAPCSEVYSSVATITIISNSTNAGTLSANQTYCESNPTPVTLNLTGYTGSIIRWESSDNNFQSSVTIGNTNSSYTIPNLTRTTQFRVMVQGAGCTPAYSNIVTITYLSNGQAGILARVGTSLPNCGSNTGSVQLNNYIGTIVDWEESTDGGTTWTSIGWDLARYDYTIATTTVFRVKVNNPSCGTIYSPTITLVPSLSLTATPYRECGNTGKIVAVANGGTPNYTYTLTPNVGIQTQLGVFTGFPAGTYTVTVKDQFNCTASATVVIPNTVSAPRIYQTVFEGNNSARVYWEAVSGNAEYEIQYSVAGMNQWVSQFAGTSTNYLIPDLDANTLYEVQVRVRCNPSIVWSAWSASTYFGTETRTATSSLNIKGIEVYPNPTNGQFIIQYDYTDTASFEVNDLAGKVILSGKLALGNNEILLPNATSGVYSLTIQSGRARKVMKIVVQR